ncbi:MAG: SbcC/MukB-like Walker B domain-containing protein [Egibacteraceae bacterium]
MSGGEKFVASLALALGMVELMARSGGRLESLFLDEGFGALDRANLDQAVEALAGVASQGRMVAVTSHIRAVAEQIDHVLAVTRHPTGSRTAWLTPSQRRDAVTADLLDDVSSAWEGLLD